MPTRRETRLAVDDALEAGYVKEEEKTLGSNNTLDKVSTLATLNRTKEDRLFNNPNTGELNDKRVEVPETLLMVPAERARLLAELKGATEEPSSLKEAINGKEEVAKLSIPLTDEEIPGKKDEREPGRLESRELKPVNAILALKRGEDSADKKLETLNTVEQLPIHALYEANSSGPTDEDDKLVYIDQM